MGRYYPVYLDLQGKGCIVIGAGVVAERKARQLLAAGASVTLVSPQATKALRQQAQEGRLTWLPRPYRQGDLAGMFLAIAATDDEAVNRQVHHEAAQEKVLLNVTDVPTLCDFIAPAVVERGPVTVAISTSGVSPALARRLRELMEGSRPVDCTEPGQTTCRCLAWADAAGVLSSVRQDLKARKHTVSPEAWQEAMDASLLALVESGRAGEAKDRLLSSLLESAPARLSRD